MTSFVFIRVHSWFNTDMRADPHRKRLFLVLCLILSFFADPLVEISSVRYFFLSRAIVEEGRFEVDSFAHASHGDLAERNGHLYSGVLPGLGLLLTPHALIAEAVRNTVPLRPNLLLQLLSLLCFNIPLAALAILLFAETLVASGVSLWRARGIAVVALLGTPLWFFTSKLSDYPITALLQVMLIRCVVVERRNASNAIGRALLVGGALGILLTVNDLSFLLSLIFLALSWPRQSSSLLLKRALGIAIGIAPCAAARAAYLAACFGSPFASPLRFSAAGITVFEQLPSGFGARIVAMLVEAPSVLYGITFGAVGLFLFAPVFWLLLPAFFGGDRSGTTHPMPLRSLFAPFLVNALLHLALVGGVWAGGASWGPRYMLFSTTFALFGLGLMNLPKRGWTFLGSLSIFINWIGVQYGYNTSLIDQAGLFFLGGPTSPFFRCLWLRWALHPTPERIALVMEETPRIGSFYAFTHPSPFTGYLVLIVLVAIVLRPLWIERERLES